MQRLSGMMAMTVVLAAMPNAVAVNGTRCPGNAGLLDPTGRWFIDCRESVSTETPHRLFLEDRQTGHVSLLLEFNRHVDALWAPDGAAVAITNYSDGSESEVYVFHADRPTTPIDIAHALVASLGEIPSLFENGHRYFEAHRWLTSSTLEFRVHAHDARPGVEYKGEFVFDLRNGTVQQSSKR